MSEYELILHFPCMKKLMNEDYKLIKELVERATPKKVIYHNEDVRYFDCPSCKTAISYDNDVKDHKYCLDCGQALSWSE